MLERGAVLLNLLVALLLLLLLLLLPVVPVAVPPTLPLPQPPPTRGGKYMMALGVATTTPHRGAGMALAATASLGR